MKSASQGISRRIRAAKRRTAFTLIEMIIVISIISVLLALLYGALQRAQKFSRRTIAYSELKNIKGAFEQYRSHYHQWPTNSLANAKITSGEDCGFAIDRDIAELLKGNITGKTEEQQAFNYEGIPFIEFSRYAPISPYPPVNPFKVTSETLDHRQYYVLFDSNGDHQISVTDSLGIVSTNAEVVADIAVWTYIPGTRSGNSSEETTADAIKDERLESWGEFGIK